MYDYETADILNYGLLKEFAKENRKCQTDAERLLWECIRAEQLGPKFKRQHIIGNYIADFVCLDKKLVIEVDGGYHAQYQQMRLDEKRTEQLKEMGFRVVRYKNEDIFNDLETVLIDIQNQCA